MLICREDRIRTCDPLVPNQVFYRAELPPAILYRKGCKYRNYCLILRVICRKIIEVCQSDKTMGSGTELALIGEIKNQVPC